MRLAKALFWSAIVVAVLVLGGAAITSIAAGSLRPLESTPSMLLGLSVAMGAASIAIWAMSTYLADPEQHMAKQFAGKATPLQLRTATFFGFVSALLIQAALFAAVTWGIEYAWTGFSLFKDPSTANYINVFLFWLDRTFQMVDAKETFGMQLSALQADTSFWPFGVCILFFRLILIATIVRAITSAFSASE